jgi:hypothetical protein
MDRRRLLAAILAAPFAPRALAQATTRVRVVAYLIEGDGYRRNFVRRMAAGAALGVTLSVAKVRDMTDVEKTLDALRDSATDAAWIAPLPAPITVKDVAASAIRRRRVATHGMGPGGRHRRGASRGSQASRRPHLRLRRDSSRAAA